MCIPVSWTKHVGKVWKMQFFMPFEIYEEFNCIAGLVYKKVKIAYFITVFLKNNVLMYPRAKENRHTQNSEMFKRVIQDMILP